MKSMLVKIVLLIVLVSSILIANTLYNNKIVKNNRKIYDSKNSINQSLEYLDELKYLTVKVEDAQNVFEDNSSEILKNNIIRMRQRESELIGNISRKLHSEVLREIDFSGPLNTLHLNKTEISPTITTTELLNLINTQKHEVLLQSNAIREIEQKLYIPRNSLMSNSQDNLRIIYYTDLTQSIFIILITIIIVRLLLSDNKKQKQLVTELKQLNATKDKFFSIISHDLRNPFQAILGFSDLLTNNFDKYPKEKVLQFITMINQTSRKTYELLENLLEWSRLQTKKLKPSFQCVSSREIINEAIQLSGASADQKYITISFTNSSDEKILADRNMLCTMLRNLISNAIKFTDINGKIEIKTQSDADNVSISISDNGVGINKADIEKLFSIETKISTTGTQGEKGTGLGLLLCKDLAELNRGTISVESEPGSGSIFTIVLPKYEEKS